MILQLKTAFILTFLSIKCSKVIDKHDQRGLYVEDYCPSIGVCEEGSHVMCTHYDPKREVGALCHGTVNVTMTKEYADLILNSINGIRSRVARGIRVGESAIPRGYGIFRLQWDAELATLAKLWADQCIYGEDRCRSTKKYPDPGQVCSLTRFTIPDWVPIAHRDLFNYSGFSLEKLKYAVKAALGGLYKTNEKLKSENLPEKLQKWVGFVEPFIQLIQGSSTHIGCGITVYQDFFYAEADQLILNIVRLCCNFSHRVREGDVVYNKEPPTKVGYTVKCGCPPGYDEDAGCLCYESGRGIPYSCKYGRCTPNVVVLPIFTAENAQLTSTTNSDVTMKSSLRQIPPLIDPQFHIYRSNYESIFTKSPIFELPTRRMHKYKHMPIIIKDVQPRKDFTHLEHIMSIFLSKRKNTLKNITNIKNFQTSSKQLYKFKTTNKPRNYHRISETVHSTRKYNHENDDKLMILLNKLEEEAKATRLDETKKDFFDEKIKNIYDKFTDKVKFANAKKLRENYKANRRNQNEDRFDGLQTSEARDDIYRGNSLNKLNIRKTVNLNTNDELKQGIMNNVYINKDVRVKKHNQKEDIELKSAFKRYMSEEEENDPEYVLSSMLPSYRQTIQIHQASRLQDL